MSNTVISYDSNEGISFTCDTFKEKGNFSGYILFLLVRNAFLKKNIRETPYYNEALQRVNIARFENLIESLRPQLLSFPDQIVIDFEKTWKTFKENYVNRVHIYEWQYGAGPDSSWYYNFEVLKRKDQFTLVYSVCSGDYSLLDGGAEYATHHPNFLTSKYLDYHSLASMEYRSIHEIVNYGVNDERGCYVLAIEENLKSVEDIKLIDTVIEADEEVTDTFDYPFCLDDLKESLQEKLNRFNTN